MKSCSHLALAASTVVLLLALPNPAGADPAGDGVLSQMDAALTRAKTLQLDYEIVNVEAGKAERTLAMRTQVKGEKRMTEFLSPADMKGTKVLVLSPTQTYVFLPAFGKVRRVASSTRGEGFLGLTFGTDDFVTTRFGGSYGATIAAESGTEWKLVLTPKAGQTPGYGKIEVTVTKDRKLPTELKYFVDGKNVKTETRSGYTCEGDVCLPGEQKMTDLVKGSWTKLVRKALRVNQGIEDDVFSQRRLGE